MFDTDNPNALRNMMNLQDFLENYLRELVLHPSKYTGIKIIITIKASAHKCIIFVINHVINVLDKTIQVIFLAISYPKKKKKKERKKTHQGIFSATFGGLL